jgi:hypothetical protein
MSAQQVVDTACGDFVVKGDPGWDFTGGPMEDITEVEVPTVLDVGDEFPLFYSGRLNTLQGESQSGKSLVALIAAMQELRKGNRVVYVDWEDSHSAVRRKLAQLGLESHLNEVGGPLSYVLARGEESTDITAKTFERFVDHVDPSLVIIDSTGEAMETDGMNQNEDGDVVRFFNRFPLRVAKPGVAVVTIDHPVKNQEKAGRYAAGSKRKLAKVDGAVYNVSASPPPAIGRTGHICLEVAKDKHARRQVGDGAVKITVHSNAEAEMKVSFFEYDRENGGGERMTPEDEIKRRVSEFLVEQGQEIATDPIKKSVKGRAQSIISALGELELSGHVGRRSDGKRILDRSLKPYPDPPGAEGEVAFPFGNVPGTDGTATDERSHSRVPPFRGERGERERIIVGDSDPAQSNEPPLVEPPWLGHEEAS